MKHAKREVKLSHPREGYPLRYAQVSNYDLWCILTSILSLDMYVPATNYEEKKVLGRAV